jgi:lambda repressor-like predicted transcriptional regulator
MPQPNQIADLVSLARVSQGLTIAELSASLGYHPSTLQAVQRLDKWRRYPKALAAVAAWLSVPVADLERIATQPSSLASIPRISSAIRKRRLVRGVAVSASQDYPVPTLGGVITAPRVTPSKFSQTCTCSCRAECLRLATRDDFVLCERMIEAERLPASLLTSLGYSENIYDRLHL